MPTLPADGPWALVLYLFTTVGGLALLAKLVDWTTALLRRQWDVDAARETGVIERDRLELDEQRADREARQELVVNLRERITQQNADIQGLRIQLGDVTARFTAQIAGLTEQVTGLNRQVAEVTGRWQAEIEDHTRTKARLSETERSLALTQLELEHTRAELATVKRQLGAMLPQAEMEG